MIDEGWFGFNNHLGAPGNAALVEMPLWPLQLLIVRLLAFFNDNLSPVFNTYFILSFPAVAVAALYSFRRLGISRLTSLLCALLYAFLPFHILRGQSQLWLIFLLYGASRLPPPHPPRSRVLCFEHV